MSDSTEYLLDIELDNELRYTEEAVEPKGGLGGRCCRLRRGETDVSQAVLYTMKIRFGEVAIAAEGYANVFTPPDHRGKGYVSKVLSQSLAGAGDRVDVVFLYGIEQLYGKFGFVTCLPSSELTLPVARAERAVKVDGMTLRPMREDELPVVIDVFNAAHAVRPWSVQRDRETWCRTHDPSIWQPGSEVTVAEVDNTVVGYMIARGDYLGTNRRFEVDEMAALNANAAYTLFAEAAKRSLAKRQETFMVCEPADSLVGRVARHLGCVVTSTYKPDGHGMAKIANRASLVRRLLPELRRRVQGYDPGAVTEAVEHLADGRLISDDGALIRLLLGYWSWDDALVVGVDPGGCNRELLVAMFPAGGTATLPQPYSHRLDHY